VECLTDVPPDLRRKMFSEGLPGGMRLRSFQLRADRRSDPRYHAVPGAAPTQRSANARLPSQRTGTCSVVNASLEINEELRGQPMIYRATICRYHTVGSRISNWIAGMLRFSIVQVLGDRRRDRKN